MIKLEIRKNAYFDSVTLMRISKDIKSVVGIDEALVGMGTDLNREIALNIGLYTVEFDAVGANDFFLAVRCDDIAAWENAQKRVEKLLNQKAETKESAYYPFSLEGAVKIESGLNMALISVPGKFACDVAQSCLERDINVLLFSDNVTIEEERKLKEYAAERELLMMGPDCGTAIINNVPLAFANVVKKGDIGIVAASGTGTQEVSSIIDQLGGGVSQVLGTGGRDLKLEIGGIMMKMGLDALKNDFATKVIVLISKPPAKQIATEILNLAKNADKPVVVSFIGGDRQEIEAMGLVAAVSLEDAAHKAIALSKGEPIKDYINFEIGDKNAEELAKEIAEKFAPSQRYVRGLYTGGTLCDEAMKLINGASIGHTFIDFGDDEFTCGRPHPMIDPSLRAERVIIEGRDETCAIIMVDCVIGCGSHENPAADLAAAIKAAKADAEANGRYLCVIAAVCGTENDPQCLSKTRAQLRDAGAVVMPSNAQAARFALRIIDSL